MVKIKRGNKEWDYSNKKGEYINISSDLKQEFNEFCKKKGIDKGKLIEEFYKSILLRFRDGSLNASNGYVTLNILRSPICKS